MRKNMKTINIRAAAVIAAISIFLPAGAFASSDTRPAPGANVLLITVDTLRFDRVGVNSSKYVKTPNIDALAGRSLIFSNAYAQSTLTRPSHTNIMTGTTPLYHGVSDNPGFRLESRYPTLAESFKSAHYRTGAFIGAFILDSQFGLDRGFDVYDDLHGQSAMVERSAEKVIRSALNWISGQREKWFCWIHLFDPHDPYTPPEPYKTLYASDPYSGEVAYVDAQLGVLFDELRKSGSLDKTVIVLTSDHGEALGDKGEERHGFFAYDSVIHVPLIVYYPGAEPKKVLENAAHTDIFPTVCELAGLPLPAQLQGESLLPLAGGQPRKNPSIYFESLSPSFFLEAAPLRGYIRGNLKFIDQPIKEVYDLAADPGEDTNLAATMDLAPMIENLETLKKSLKGKGTKQDLEGKNQDIRPLMESLGYLSGNASSKKSYGLGDDLKSLQPLIAQLQMAVREAESGKSGPALAKLTNIIRIRPTYVSAYSAAARIDVSLGRLDQAVAVLRDGLDRNPDSLHLMADYGETLLRARKFAEAIEPLKVCVDRDRTNPEYLNYLARAYLESGDFKRAEEQLEKAVALDPDMVEAFNNLGYLNLILFVRTGDEDYYDSSIQNFNKALSFNPGLESALKGKEAAVTAKAKFEASVKK
jgi:arylsulfatase A-like enzyme/Tfp pilus assembly protein PilF